MATRETFDYIIVGGGTSGCVLASRLSQQLPSSRNRILLLEHGPDALQHPHVTDPSAWPKLTADGLAVAYQTTPQAQLNGRVMTTITGRMLSGSSGANVGNWNRGCRADYHSWAKLAGHERFEFENLLPYLKRTETWHGAASEPEHHGYDGPVNITTGRTYPLRESLLEGFREVGATENRDLFSGNLLGVSEWAENFKIVDGKALRQHAGSVYDLSRVDVRTGMRVDKILLDQTQPAPRAVGVQVKGGQELYAKHEVIICAGALKSPQLLMLSGIGRRRRCRRCSRCTDSGPGPKAELQKHGVPVVVDSPEVGRNHWDHLGLAPLIKLQDPSKGQSLLGPGFWKPEYAGGSPMDWNFWHTLPVSDGFRAALKQDGIEFEESIYADPQRPHVSLSVLYAPFPLLNPDKYTSVPPDGGKRIVALTLLMLPSSRGTLSLKSADPGEEPELDPNFLSTAVDRHLFAEMVRSMWRVMESTSMAKEVLGEETPDGFCELDSTSSDEEILRRAAEFASTVFHPAGTTALGKVVDAEFRVFGTQCLRVIDAGTFPEPMAGFPQSTAYCWGELGADLVSAAARG